MLVGESLKTLLYPFEWSHVYVPIVPTTYMNLMDAPVTYLMGLTADLSLEDQPDICVLDVDNCNLLLPEDIPNLPNREGLVRAISAILVRPSASQPTDPFSRLKLTTISTPDQKSPEIKPTSLAQRRLNRPPRLKIIRTCNAEFKDVEREEERARQTSINNLAIRNVFIDHLAKMLQNYDKFVIYPPDRAYWEAHRDSMDNFERDVFLCDQPEDTLSFLSRFLETHMFSSYIDSKILCTFNVPCEGVAHFDSKVEDIRNNVSGNIMSPMTAEG